MDIDTVLAEFLGNCLMMGSKTALDHVSLQAMEHSIGVTLMLRKPCS